MILTGKLGDQERRARGSGEARSPILLGGPLALWWGIASYSGISELMLTKHLESGSIVGELGAFPSAGSQVFLWL